jgi:hypothetical protein
LFKPLTQEFIIMIRSLKTMIPSAALAFSLMAAALPASAVTTLNFTGQVATANTFQIVAGSTAFDFWAINLDSFTPFTVAQGDEVEATVSLDATYTLPTSVGFRIFRLFFFGQDFAGVGDTETSGGLELFNGATSVLTIDPQGCGTSGAVAACDSLDGSGLYTFDKAVFTFTVTALAMPLEVTSASFDAVVSNPLPVPEAQTWAMLTAGLALLGAAVRRQKAKGQRDLSATE